MSRSPVETKEAIQLLSSGSTKGMIRNRLIDSGLSDDLADEAIEAAAVVVNQRARFISLLIAIAGLLVACVGGAWLYYETKREFPIIRVPVTVLGMGVMTLIYGGYGLFWKRV